MASRSHDLHGAPRATIRLPVLVSLLVSISFVFLVCVAHAGDGDPFRQADSRLAAEPGAPVEHKAFSERAGERLEMTSAQLARRGIKDERVLGAMRRVPRHAFMPKEMHHLAYGDYPVSIGFGQTISQPYIVAFMTQALGPGKQARVLEIGTGSGYQAAVLAELVKEVYTIEIIPDLGRRARKVCTNLGYGNIRYRIGDGYEGWPEAAPFDAIIVTAAPGHIPQPLIDQLAVGGRMIIPVGKNRQELVLLEREPDGVVRRHVMAVRFVPMTGEAEKH